MNTMLIIAQQTADSPAGEFAALICANLTHGNLGDWYLPALYELSLMYINRSLLNMQPAPYWSSSEGVDVAAQVLDFATGTLYATTKDFQHRVRAIRAF